MVLSLMHYTTPVPRCQRRFRADFEPTSNFRRLTGRPPIAPIWAARTLCVLALQVRPALEVQANLAVDLAGQRAHRFRWRQYPVLDLLDELLNPARDLG